MEGGFALGDLRMLDDVSCADWVVCGVRNFEYDVGSLVPLGFEAYARVFHPATRREGDAWVEVRWAEVAAANGRVAHGGMEWGAITGEWRFLSAGGSQPGVWDMLPSTGSLPIREAATLARVLAGFTEMPSSCRFAVWDGSGAPAYPRGVAPTVPMPNRPMALFAGPLEAVTTSFDRPPWDQRAHLWWPDDRRWCVAGDTDLMTTYVGGEAACIDAVLAEPALETFAVSVDQRIAWDSDALNPPPRGRDR